MRALAMLNSCRKQTFIGILYASGANRVIEENASQRRLPHEPGSCDVRELACDGEARSQYV